MKSVGNDPSPEHAAILRLIAAIPAGCVASYGEIAARAGRPRCARLVGRLLRTAPAGWQLPWHRVIRADGRSAFAPGSRNHREQLRRLAREGVRPIAGRIDLVRHGWERAVDLDAELWGPAPRLRETHASQ
ncbi:MAG TPA: MGMT family protein [Rhodanobacteraceae bacterium]|nr:MGMT family protein [Rhodanobacteraceae bacterium]